jgi:fatty-acyl-CoA synthase
MMSGERLSIIEKTIGQVLNGVVKKYPENVALIYPDQDIRYDYKMFLVEIERLAKGFLKIGLEIGDKVALWANNIPQWIICQMALAKIGAILVPIDPGVGAEDLKYILEQSETSYIVMEKGLEGGEYLSMLSGIGHGLLLKHIVIGGGNDNDTISWERLSGMGDQLDSRLLAEREDQIRADDPVAIMYTSGTTGKPKGVVLDHVGLINKSMSSAHRQGLVDKDRLCLFFPLFHMFGNTCVALTGIFKGATIVMPCKIFEPPRILSSISREKCTAIYASPSMVIALVDHADFSPEKFKTVSKGIIGGSPCPAELMRRLVEDLGLSDITVAYGITETSSWITMTKPGDPLDLRVSTIGTALECNEVKILNPISGKEMPAGHQGELCARGFLMKEYYRLPAATASAIDKEGWFHSGDLGEVSKEGYFKITGRLKDVIVRSGIEIYPTDVEEVIYKLPGVSEVQVFGFSYPGKGQEVAAWVKLREGSTLSPGDLKEYGKGNIHEDKEPHYYKFVHEFPMTRSGKVQKFRLAELAEKEYLA